jgi:hypothetical protein
MEVEFEYTCEDWAEVDALYYKGWLYGLRPLAGVEYGLCWLLFLISVVGGISLLGFLAAAVWLNPAWYLVVGAAALLVFAAGMALEVMRPRREPVRGLIHELVFRLNRQDELCAKMKPRRAARFRRLEKAGRLSFAHRYRLRLDPEGLTLTTEYPTTSGTATRQEDRVGWDAVSAIGQDDHLLSFTLRDGRCIFVPLAAFADVGGCEPFVRAAEAYRVPAPAVDTRIQAPTGLRPAGRSVW